MREITSAICALLLLAATSLAATDVAPLRVDSVFAQFTLPGSPGCAVAVIDHGRTVYSRAFGLADVGHEVPNSVETVFDIGSNAKQFTATAILLLEEQGKLSIDDPVRKFIPELPEYDWPITLRHLLTHTSGIRDYFDLMSLKGEFVGNNYSDDHYLNLVFSQSELNFRPGDQQMYSNSGFILLAEIVQRVSGVSLAQFARENIFQPLGMTHTRFVEDLFELVSQRANSYGRIPSGGYWQGVSCATNAGDGGMLSTLADLALWDANFYKNQLGEKRSSLIERLQEEFVLNSGDTIGWALGLRTAEYKGLPVVFHGGAYFGFRSELLRFPRQQFSVIILGNYDQVNTAVLAYEVADLYLQDQFREEVSEAALAEVATYRASEEELRTKVGKYRNPVSGTIWTVEAEDTSLVVATSTGFVFQLIPMAKEKYRATGLPQLATVEFTKRDDGGWSVFLELNGQAPARLEPFVESSEPIHLADYVGRYHCRELGLTFSVAIENEALVYSSEGDRQTAALQPSLRDEFSVAGGQLQFRFLRDERDSVNSFAVSLQRAKNIRFERQAG